MPDIRFEPSVDGDKISLNIYGLDQAVVDEKELAGQFQRTEFRRYLLDEEALQKACKIFKKLQHDQRQAATTEDTPAPAPVDAAPAVSVVVAEKRPAHVELEISPDKMQCFMMIETAFGGENPGAADFARYLADLGVVFGIKQNILQALATRLDNMPPGTRLRELVAEGVPVGETRQAEFHFKVEPVQDRLMKPQLRDDGTVDMHDFGEIHLVKPGDILMVRTPPVPGTPGTTVLGETLFAAAPLERPLVAGEGTELNSTDHNMLVASRKGVALRSDSGMMVADTYCVQDVDLRTGNITFDGSVLIQGSVREGMSVKATGDVMVCDYVESASVEAGRSLIVGKGVLGRQTEHRDEKTGLPVCSVKLQCGGDFHANYAQYADIAAGGKVTVIKHLMHCHVVADEIEVVSSKRNEGKILGGLLCPLKSLDCNVLGAPSYIHTAVDFSRRFATELAELVNINEELGERVNVVRGMRGALRQFDSKTGSPDIVDQVNKINNTIAHYEKLMLILKQSRHQLMETIKSVRETLEINVQKSLFPGVTIRYVDKEIPVREEKGPCRIKAKDESIAFFTVR